MFLIHTDITNNIASSIIRNIPCKSYKLAYIQTHLTNATSLAKPSTARNMKFSIKYFFGKCDQIRRKLRIWLHLSKKLLMENFIFSELLHTHILWKDVPKLIILKKDNIILLKFSFTRNLINIRFILQNDDWLENYQPKK